MMVTWKGGIPVGKSSTDTCCLTLPLKLEKWQEDRLAKRFEIARQIYNTMVRAELKKLDRVKQLPEYRKNQKEIQALDWKNSADKQRLKELYGNQRKILQKQGFTEYGFKSDSKDYYKHFIENIGSSVATHGIAPQVWNAFDKMLFQKMGKSSILSGMVMFIRSKEALLPIKAAGQKSCSAKPISSGRG